MDTIQSTDILSRMDALSFEYMQLLEDYHPFSDLPDSIISKILILATHSHQNPCLRYEFPLTAQCINKTFRRIIQQTPQVWTFFHNMTPTGMSLFQERVLLSDSEPLEIHLALVSLHPAQVTTDLKYLIGVPHRWKSLAITTSEGAYVDIPVICGLLLNPWPENLSTFRIECPDRQASHSNNCPDRQASHYNDCPLCAIPPPLLPLSTTRLDYEAPNTTCHDLWSPSLYKGNNNVKELVIRHVPLLTQYCTNPASFIHSLHKFSHLEQLDLSELAIPSSSHNLLIPSVQPSSTLQADPAIKVLFLPSLQSVALRNMPFSTSSWLLSNIDAPNLSSLTLNQLTWPTGTTPWDGLYKWDGAVTRRTWSFPNISSLHLLELPFTRITIPHIINALSPPLNDPSTTSSPSIRHLSFSRPLLIHSTTSEQNPGTQCNFEDLYQHDNPPPSFWHNLETLSTRYVHLPLIRHFINLVVPPTKSFLPSKSREMGCRIKVKVHLEDVSLTFEDDLHEYIAMDKDVAKFREAIPLFEVDCENLSSGAAVKRFTSLAEREEWRKKNWYPELVY